MTTTTLFTFPIKPGKLNTYIKFMRECVNGSKKAEYKDLLIRYGMNTVKMWHHNFNGHDYVLFTHDISDDGFERLKGWSTSTHPFDKWFNEQLQDCYENSDASSPAGQPVFVCELDARK